MSSAVATRRVSRRRSCAAVEPQQRLTFPEPKEAVRQRTPVDASGSTFEDVLLGVWEDLEAPGTAVCPLCSGTMEPRYGAGPNPVGGRCGDCGTTLE